VILALRYRSVGRFAKPLARPHRGGLSCRHFRNDIGLRGNSCEARRALMQQRLRIPGMVGTAEAAALTPIRIA